MTKKYFILIFYFIFLPRACKKSHYGVTFIIIIITIIIINSVLKKLTVRNQIIFHEKKNQLNFFFCSVVNEKVNIYFGRYLSYFCSKGNPRTHTIVLLLYSIFISDMFNIWLWNLMINGDLFIWLWLTPLHFSFPLREHSELKWNENAAFWTVCVQLHSTSAWNFISDENSHPFNEYSQCELHTQHIVLSTSSNANRTSEIKSNFVKFRWVKIVYCNTNNTDHIKDKHSSGIGITGDRNKKKNQWANLSVAAHVFRAMSCAYHGCCGDTFYAFVFIAKKLFINGSNQSCSTEDSMIVAVATEVVLTAIDFMEISIYY